MIAALIRQIAHGVMAVGSRLTLLWVARVSIEGREHLPRSGPVLIVARHYHHLYDGCVFLSRVPQGVHIFVALDWIRSQRTRRTMEWACNLLTWPVVLRAEQLQEASDQETPGAYTAQEVKTYLLRGVKSAVQLLRAGKVLVIFPEAYPNIDPHPNAKLNPESFLPFKAGFVRLVELAERHEQRGVAIVPAGFTYKRLQGRWQITLRYGAPLYRSDFADPSQLVREIESQVHQLSTLTLPSRTR